MKPNDASGQLATPGYRDDWKRTKGPLKVRCCLLLFVAALLMLPRGSLQAQTPPRLPKVVNHDGRSAFLLDGHPFFILGAQIHNSSSWPTSLPKVWTLAEGLHANTIEAPIYWEHFERSPGQFDYSTIDMLIHQARNHHVHLVLLWFGTWKNGRMHYVPEWIKANPHKFPLMTTRDGDHVDVLSPYSKDTLDADKTAFSALMRHLKIIDGQKQTVIMVQVENESGSLGTVRDYSQKANTLFSGPVPQPLVTALHKQPGTWSQVFNDDADEAFAAYGIASYINQVVAAGKAEYALPMYCNVWLRNPVDDVKPGVSYPSGGPTYNMLAIWKAAAPDVDLLAPDIYLDKTNVMLHVLQEYHRPDNPLFIPETLGMSQMGDLFDLSRYLFYALGQDSFGFSPFGIDSLPDDAFQKHVSPILDSDAASYRLLGSMDQELAELLFQGKVKTAVQEPQLDHAVLDFGRWKVVVSFHRHWVSPNAPTPVSLLHDGRVLIAAIGPDEFLVAGFDVRVDFFLAHPAVHEHPQYLRVEEGSYEGTAWKPTRWLNGDETDYGLNFGDTGSISHVRMGTY